LTILDIGERSGVNLQAGLHTGECHKLEDGRLSGLAVDVAGELVAHANPGEVLVSSTVRDLVAGAGIRFFDVGNKHLKHIPGDWRLFIVERSVGAFR
jgi:class 3 adenylate cyclase